MITEKLDKLTAAFVIYMFDKYYIFLNNETLIFVIMALLLAKELHEIYIDNLTIS